MYKKNKKKWIKAQLVVLTRDMPQERVCDVCKQNTGELGPDRKRDGCWLTGINCYALTNLS